MAAHVRRHHLRGVMPASSIACQASSAAAVALTLATCHESLLLVLQGCCQASGGPPAHDAWCRVRAAAPRGWQAD